VPKLTPCLPEVIVPESVKPVHDILPDIVPPLNGSLLFSCVCIADMTPCTYASSAGVQPQNVNVFVPKFVKRILPVRVRTDLSRTQLFS